ncbi:uncharacterized protein [Anoplolepis gracilipes]|uniref:uncharacterized protein isoform X3 n=1 Tax=Anoplolepis gracilipes TaxID=354296 RepID=UPI003B9E4B66
MENGNKRRDRGGTHVQTLVPWVVASTFHDNDAKARTGIRANGVISSSYVRPRTFPARKMQHASGITANSNIYRNSGDESFTRFTVLRAAPLFAKRDAENFRRSLGLRPKSKKEREKNDLAVSRKRKSAQRWPATLISVGSFALSNRSNRGEAAFNHSIAYAPEIFLPAIGGADIQDTATSAHGGCLLIILTMGRHGER